MESLINKKELFQIGEVSRLFHISVGILRHYEKIGLLIPEYTDSKTGYRYYGISQFECLNTIRYLRALDMPLEKIALFMNNRDVNQIQNLLTEQKKELEIKRHELEMIERKITNRLEQIGLSLTAKTDVISVEQIGERKLAILKKQVIPHSYLDLETSIRELEKNETRSITFLGKVGIGLSEEALKHKRFKPYEFVFIILDKEDQYNGESVILPEETCVIVRFRGNHERASKYYKRLIAYITDNNLKIAGFSKEITMIDNGMTNDEKQFLTEIQIPVQSEILVNHIKFQMKG